MAYNILIVDDEKFNLDAIRRTLRRESEYNLFMALDGMEALKILKENQPIHMIITDQRMPGMSGIEFLQKSLEISPYTIRIILTAYTDMSDMVDAINKGQVYRYIVKPWKPEELKITIKLGLDYYRAIEEKMKLLEELKVKSQLLEKQNVELRKLADMKSRFLVVSSHELRTPATIISGSLELLQINSANFSEEQKRTLDNALNGAFRLNKIIETFFEMVKMDSQTSPLVREAVYLGELIRAAVIRFKNALDERQIAIHYESNSVVEVLVDRKKIFAVFEHLISNAIKFTRDGGAIYFKWENPRDGFVKISIRDTGIGIPQGEEERIFETFYQLNNVKHHHSSDVDFMGGGPGLGLSFCKHVVEAHGGTIFASSGGEDKGTTLWLTLPVEENLES